MYALGAVEFTLGGTLLIYDTIYSKLRFVYDDEIAQNLQTTGDSIAEVHLTTTPGFDPAPSEEVLVVVVALARLLVYGLQQGFPLERTSLWMRTFLPSLGASFIGF